jgi:RNA polymerase sigma-70 factor (ECF subfamily)
MGLRALDGGVTQRFRILLKRLPRKAGNLFPEIASNGFESLHQAYGEDGVKTADGLARQTAQSSQLSDEQLVELIRQGDHAGYSTIMQRYNRRLYRTARGILGDDGEAEDVVQEAYVRAFQHLATFRGEAAFGTWLTRITINEALGRRRKSRSTIKLGNLDEPLAQGESRVIVFPGFGADSNLETEIGNRQMRRMLENAIDGLPEPFRIVFVLREVEQLNVAETAEQLELRPETVKTRLHRARRLLRAALEEKFGSALHEAYSFDGKRCDRLTKMVLDRLNPS